MSLNIRLNPEGNVGEYRREWFLRKEILFHMHYCSIHVYGVLLQADRLKSFYVIRRFLIYGQSIPVPGIQVFIKSQYAT